MTANIAECRRMTGYQTRWYQSCDWRRQAHLSTWECFINGDCNEIPFHVSIREGYGYLLINRYCEWGKRQSRRSEVGCCVSHCDLQRELYGQQGVCKFDVSWMDSNLSVRSRWYCQTCGPHKSCGNSWCRCLSQLKSGGSQIGICEGRYRHRCHWVQSDTDWCEGGSTIGEARRPIWDTNYHRIGFECSSTVSQSYWNSCWRLEKWNRCRWECECVGWKCNKRSKARSNSDNLTFVVLHWRKGISTHLVQVCCMSRWESGQEIRCSVNHSDCKS